MADRFRDNEIWKRPWYRKLGSIGRDAYNYIHDSCDCVGVWIPDFEAAEFYIGSKIDWESILENCHNNIEVLPDGKWWIVDFCDYQYGELTESCKPHKKYIALLRRYGLLDRVLKGYTKGIDTLQEKEKEKEKEKEEDISSLSISSLNSNEPKVSNGSNRIDKHMATWNSLGARIPQCRGNSYSLKESDRSGVLRTLQLYPDGDIDKAMRNYSDILQGVDYEAFPEYATFWGFLVGGVEKYADDAKPFDRCRKKQGVDYDEQRRQEARAHLRKIQEEDV